MTRRRVFVAVGVVALGVTVALLVGLDGADKLASVASALIAAAALVLSRGAASSQRVSRSRIGGSVDLAGADDQRVERSTVRRSVRMRRDRP